MGKTYIIFTKGNNYFIASGDNEKLIVCEYMKYLGKETSIIEKMCVGPTEFTLPEIINYTNSLTYGWEDDINTIYELGEIIYVD